MGSHGGGTAEGQVAALASLGITEAAMGAPIMAEMATVPADRGERVRRRKDYFGRR
jgi:hypothetical protein